ncbi:hypothetical protein HY636_06450 [Candidatus Woesearchaeota archaeon]|nr:hypothetical protein [Candidatus Woesearchaeota archaeon]
MIQPNWENVAKHFLKSLISMHPYIHPTPIDVMVEWRKGMYIGHIQIIFPDYSPEIVSLSKSSNHLQDGLVDAIRRLDPNRLNLMADERLDLTGRIHVLRRLENILTNPTPEQAGYIAAHPLYHREVDASIRN